MNTFTAPMALAAVGACLILSTCAEAEAQACMPAEKVRQVLASRFHEIPVSYGQIDASSVLMLFLAPDGETFSLVVMRTDGLGCLLSSGTGWEQRDVPGKPDREG